MLGEAHQPLYLCHPQHVLPHTKAHAVCSGCSQLHNTTGTAHSTLMSVQVLLCPQQRYSCVHVWLLHLGSLRRAQQRGEADGDNVPDAAVCGLDLPGTADPNQLSLLLVIVCQP